MHLKGISMTDIHRCSQCLGAKKVMGMGMMTKECPTCKGIGWIKKERIPFKEELAAEPAKRRGRPPKNVKAHTPE